MKKYLTADEWCIIEDGFNPDNHRSSESIFSLGNGKMGQRANFEEKYSGPTLQGSYIAGIYYPDKTRVGWWKNGYPEYFAKVLNSPNYIGIDVTIDGEMLNLFICKVSDFRRVLNMKEGTLERTFKAEMSDGKQIEVSTKRFLSMADTETAAIRYSVKPLNFSGKIGFVPYIDGGVVNTDSNYDEAFWNILEMDVKGGQATLVGQTKKLDFRVAFSMRYKIYENSNELNVKPELIKKEAWIGNRVIINGTQGSTITIEKYIGVTSTLNYSPETIMVAAETQSQKAMNKGYDRMMQEHIAMWANKWKHSDIKIEGDIEAQQAIRFNIFQLNQTYTGEDDRLNVGPKGFTGEKYGGTTYWDTEAYCIPFFISTADPKVTRQLLVYRYKHLERAIENAQKLGFNNGAALYPMVTINGEECHNEWEITFEEIHRNGAIAFAIHNYIRHTLDYKYLEEYGLEVLIGIARFWSQRITFSEERGKYVMLGVTGPNEYENNVNNNWYTSRLANWCMKYAAECIEYVKRSNEQAWMRISKKLNFDEKETERWHDINNNMHYAFNEKLNIFMQQDGYMDKEQILTSQLPASERPINQHWSWDRILRSCFIKQADTLQGIYLFEDEFDTDTIARHFDFYEPRTVHESSLSPCVHSILASRIGRKEKAYEMYLRTSRLDLDDYNSEAHEGLHITSMAGTWMSIVEGFGGKRAYNGKLYLKPSIPDQWKSYTFFLTFRGHDIEVTVDAQGTTIKQHGNGQLDINVYGNDCSINDGEVRQFNRN
ncbi:MAG: family 65 glycosyl hydrolase domain-containing protein [Bacteroidales bacterium]|nr:family 65 glycosyl hydrolase domain-containing protein [Bacteroidales bacterium]